MLIEQRSGCELMSMSLINITYAAVLLFLFAPCHLMADVLQMANGDRVVGVVVEDEPSKPSFIFRTVRGLLTLQRNKVVTWEHESEAKGWIQMGDEYSRSNRPQAALEAYKKSAELEPGNSEAKSRVWEAQARLNDAAAKDAQTSNVKQENDVVDTSGTLNPRQVMDLLSLAQTAAASNRYSDAVKYLDKVNPASAAGAGQEFAQGAAAIYVNWGRERSDHQDVNTAIDLLKKALYFDPNNAQATALLKKVMEFESGRLGEMEDLYKNDMTPNGRLKYGEALFRGKKFTEALPVFLEICNDPDRVTPSVKSRVRTIYETMHQEAAERGDWQQALAVYNQFLVFDPMQPKSVLYKYEYMIRRSTTDMSNPQARVALAKYAESKGMLDTAKQEYTSILEMQETNEDARKGLLAYAGRDLREVQNSLAAGDTAKAREKANMITMDYPMFPEVVQAAQSVLITAQVNERQAVSDKSGQAKSLVSQGDQYYNTAIQILMSAGVDRRDNNNRIFSTKQEGVKNLNLAINYWSQALRLDPGLGAPANGNLRARINDAQRRVNSLTSTAPAKLPQPLDFKRM